MKEYVKTGLILAVISVLVSVTVVSSGSADEASVTSDDDHEEEYVVIGVIWGRYNYFEVSDLLKEIGCDAGDLRIVGRVIGNPLVSSETGFAKVIVGGGFYGIPLKERLFGVVTFTLLLWI